MKLLLTFVFIFLLAGCKKDEIDPREAILGKWENFYVGNGEYRPPIEDSLGYWHFLPDSVLLEYDYSTKKTLEKKYWIDSLLHVGIQRENGFWLTLQYSTKFYADTMELHVEHASAIFYVSKWKHIN